MLLRILTDNPARAFTQNFDAKFVSTVKELIRDGKDASVQQILRETLDHFEAEKAPSNDTLGPLVEMWKKEKGKKNTIRQSVGWGSLEAVDAGQHTDQAQSQRPAPGQYQQQPARRPDLLPPPDELAGRIEEAKTTARLLVQTVQSTPQSELLANDLVREFAERARTAQRSMQKFMNCQNPAPDPDTMLTMIETSDQLNIAMSKHQRAVLGARKATGLSTPSPQPQFDVGQTQAPVHQHSLGQNVYATGTSQPPDHGPYAASPPRRQNTIPTPVSPPRSEEMYAPPPGPPPSAQTARTNQVPPATYDFSSDAFTASDPAPPVPDRVRPQGHGYSSSADYGVGDNPFADDAYSADPGASQKPQALFDQSENAPPSQPQQYSGNQYSNDLSSEHHRPGPYNAGYQPTPSYMHRQESSAEHVTMHGGNSPPTQNGQHQPDPMSANVYGNNPVSPIDETQGVGHRMNDLRI